MTRRALSAPLKKGPAMRTQLLLCTTLLCSSISAHSAERSSWGSWLSPTSWRESCKEWWLGQTEAQKLTQEAFDAISKGDIPALTTMLEDGMPFNAWSQTNTTLHVAIKNDQVDAARLLLRYGYQSLSERPEIEKNAFWNPVFSLVNNLKNQYELPLAKVAYKKTENSVAMLELLLDYGAYHWIPMQSKTPNHLLAEMVRWCSLPHGEAPNVLRRKLKSVLFFSAIPTDEYLNPTDPLIKQLVNEVVQDIKAINEKHNLNQIFDRLQAGEALEDISLDTWREIRKYVWFFYNNTHSHTWALNAEHQTLSFVLDANGVRTDDKMYSHINRIKKLPPMGWHRTTLEQRWLAAYHQQ